jgi:hypothetical protein
MNVLSATATCNLCGNDGNTEVDCIEIVYNKFVPGYGYRKITDYVYTTPVGNWTNLKFHDCDDVQYTNFLNTMVFKNIEVYRKLAKIALYRILDTPLYKINLLNAICILDPTFIPPYINKKCAWQRNLIETIISSTSIHVICTCYNIRRLERYFNVLQSLKV